jgi:hypothetical protein
MRCLLALSLILSPSLAHAAAEPANPPATVSAACDRECLRSTLTEVLYALTEHDVSALAVASNLRVTEDAVEKPLDKVGLVRSVSKLRGYRQDVIDERTGQALAGVMVEESGAPTILVVRVKVDGQRKISELEFVATRSRADGLIFAIDGYSGAAPKAMNIAPQQSQLPTRDEAVRIAMHYPRGLNSAPNFNSINTPFSPKAYRVENGALMAGPGCTFAPGCDDIGNQPLVVPDQVRKVAIRDIIVDERMGIVAMRLSWDQRGSSTHRLTMWEMFKIYDGQIHMVLAYMRLFPLEQDLGGWPISAGITQP